MYNNTVSVDFSLSPSAVSMNNYALQNVSVANLTDSFIAYRLPDQEPGDAELTVCPAGISVDLGSRLMWDRSIKYDVKIAPVSYDGESDVLSLSVKCYSPANYINNATIFVIAHTSDCSGANVISFDDISCGERTCDDEKMCSSEFSCDLSTSPSSNSTRCYLVFDGLLKKIMKNNCVTVKEGVDYGNSSMPKLCGRSVFFGDLEVTSTTSVTNATVSSSIEGNDIVTTIVVPVVRNNSGFIENVTRGLPVDPDSLEADFKNITERLSAEKDTFSKKNLYIGVGSVCAALVGATVTALTCYAKKLVCSISSRKKEENVRRSSLYTVEGDASSVFNNPAFDLNFGPVGESEDVVACAESSDEGSVYSAEDIEVGLRTFSSNESHSLNNSLAENNEDVLEGLKHLDEKNEVVVEAVVEEPIDDETMRRSVSELFRFMDSEDVASDLIVTRL